MTTKFPHHPEHLRPILDEFFLCVNENEPEHLWFYPGPSILPIWSAGSQAFYEDSLFYGLKEAEMPPALRWCVKTYQKEMKNTDIPNPPSPKSLLKVWLPRYVKEKRRGVTSGFCADCLGMLPCGCEEE